MKQRFPFIVLLLVSLAVPLSSTAAARDGLETRSGAGGRVMVADAAAAKDEISLSEAVARVRREYGGRILEAETRGQNGRRVHVIKVLTDEGRVRTVRIPAGGNGRRD